ncbi:MAG: SRPBCC domain-containing protein [Chloroflexota bacterium]|nr:SRPBCC domain-containing protein [Chloroflexota bacterium]
MDEEHIFKALADVSRRALLDLLFQRDGQTLSELEAHFEMTRFGVMKHLQILEDAGLLTTKKVGREKRHYLNPVPIQLVYDRWVSKYAQPWTRALTDIKDLLEQPTMDQKVSHVFHVYIRTTPERLWQALTDGTITQHYYFNTRIESKWSMGAGYRYINADGSTLANGDVVEIDPPRRLVQTFYAQFAGEIAAAQPSRVVWEIEAKGDVCKLTLTHLELDPATQPIASMIEGWGQILSGLKTWLETGAALSLRIEPMNRSES